MAILKSLGKLKHYVAQSKVLILTIHPDVRSYTMQREIGEGQFRDGRTQSFGGRGRAGASQGSYQESAASASSVRGPCDRCGRFHSGECWRCYH